MKLAYGVYQQALLSGYARWSGADLKGKANKYAKHYAISRTNLLNRIVENDFGHLKIELNGLIVLVEGLPPKDAKETKVAAGQAWRY